MKEYEVVIDGTTHTVQLDQEDLGRYPGAKPVEAQAAKPADREPGVEPPRAGAGSGLEAWVAFAREKGATEVDLLDADGKPLSRDALAEKYTAATS